MVEEAKARGNAAFEKRDFRNAIRHYSDGIALDPANHVLYSNRSAAYAALEQWPSALSDALKTVELNLEWPRGHQRIGAASLGLGRVEAAVHAFKQGLLLDPDDAALKRGYEQAEAEARRKIEPLKPHPFGDVFQVPEMWERLTSDATTRVYAGQSDFVEMMSNVQRDCFKIEEYSEDPRLLAALGALLNVNFRAASPDNSTARAESDPPSEKPVQSDKTVLRLGMKEYAGDFGAFKLDEETQKETASASASTGEEATRTETALTLTSSAYEAAVESLRKSLSENLYSDLLSVLHDASRRANDLQEVTSIDPKILDGDTKSEGVHRYTEKLKNDSSEIEAYNTRAACSMKLGEFSEALKDAEKCIELEPKSPLGYWRKGDALFCMEEYDQATGIYMQGLQDNPTDSRLLDGLIKCMSRTNGEQFVKESKASQDEAVPEPTSDSDKKDEAFARPSLDQEKGNKSSAAAAEQGVSLGSSEVHKEADRGELDGKDSDGELVKRASSFKETLMKELQGKKVLQAALEEMLQEIQIEDEDETFRINIFNTDNMAPVDGDESGKRAIAERLRYHCTKRLESNPETPKLYSNRSMCHMKLGNFHDGLKDAEKCIELDPCLWTGYHRKGQILFCMKEFDAAVDTYMLGLDQTRNNGELFKAFQKSISEV